MREIHQALQAVGLMERRVRGSNNPILEGLRVHAVNKFGVWGICLLLILMFDGCSKGTEQQRAYFGEHLTCPAPAVEEFGPWGKSGSQHICKIAHGPFVAFESNHVVLRGQYENGGKSGIWRWYDSNGKVEKEIDYSRTP